MRKLRLLAAVALIGSTAVACSYNTRTYDPGFTTGTTTQYVMSSPGYSTTTTQYVVTDQPYYAPRSDRDGDGVPNRYDRRPDNPYRY